VEEVEGDSSLKIDFPYCTVLPLKAYVTYILDVNCPEPPNLADIAQNRPQLHHSTGWS
jgi:hypothetical protein